MRGMSLLSRETYVAIGMIILTACLISLMACAPEGASPPSPTAVVQAPPATSEPTSAVPPTEEPTVTARPTEESPAKPKRPKAGNPAFDFTLQDLQGNQISLSDFRGQVVMLNFWASWCGPCRIEIPHMIELYQEKRDQDFEIVAVNLRENPNRVEGFAQKLNMPFPVLLDQKGRVGAAYYVRGIPTSIFIDEEGVIRHVHVGTLTESALERYVNDLL